VIARLIEDNRRPQGHRHRRRRLLQPQETRALILDKAIAVWLDSDVDTLVERVRRKDNRPLLRGGNPREILARLREERESAYAQAPIHVISTNGPHAHRGQGAERD
jgi:shikimate kinase